LIDPESGSCACREVTPVINSERRLRGRHKSAKGKMIAAGMVFSGRSNHYFQNRMVDRKLPAGNAAGEIKIEEYEKTGSNSCWPFPYRIR
jgi:hypothetical protein